MLETHIVMSSLMFSLTLTEQLVLVAQSIFKFDDSQRKTLGR
jgi:hypothetical protein